MIYGQIILLHIAAWTKWTQWTALHDNSGKSILSILSIKSIKCRFLTKCALTGGQSFNYQHAKTILEKTEQK